MTKRGLELNEANTEIMQILSEIKLISANFERYIEKQTKVLTKAKVSLPLLKGNLEKS